MFRKYLHFIADIVEQGLHCYTLSSECNSSVTKLVK